MPGVETYKSCFGVRNVTTLPASSHVAEGDRLKELVKELFGEFFVDNTVGVEPEDFIAFIEASVLCKRFSAKAASVEAKVIWACAKAISSRDSRKTVKVSVDSRYCEKVPDLHLPEGLGRFFHIRDHTPRKELVKPFKTAFPIFNVAFRMKRRYR